MDKPHQDKYNRILENTRFAVLTIAKMGKGRHSPEKAILEALQTARSEEWGNRKHGTRLPIEAQRALAEELVQVCRGLFDANECQYLQESIERFFNPKPDNKQLAAQIIAEAATRADAKFERTIRETLPRQLAKRTKAEKDEFLRQKLVEMREWQVDNYRLSLDVERHSPEQLAASVLQHLYDNDSGVQPFKTSIPNNPAFPEALIMMLAERFFVSKFIAYLVDLIDNSKAHQMRPSTPGELLNDDFAETIRQALEARGLLRDGEFIGTTTQVKALFNVLRPKFGRLTYPEEKFAEFFSDRFGFKVTGRTLQNTPNKKQDIEEREFRTLIPE